MQIALNCSHFACLQLTAPSSSIPGQPQAWSGPAESLISCCKRETVLKTFLLLLTKPKADHLVSWKTIQIQNKMHLKTVPQIAKHLKKPGHGLNYIKITWTLFVKIILNQEGSKQLTTQKCHRCTCKCLSIILLIPDCKSRRDCQILCSDCLHAAIHCISLREPKLSPAAPAGFWHFSPEEAEPQQPQAGGSPPPGALVTAEKC